MVATIFGREEKYLSKTPAAAAAAAAAAPAAAAGRGGVKGVGFPLVASRPRSGF